MESGDVVRELRLVQGRAFALDRPIGLDLSVLDRLTARSGGWSALPHLLATPIGKIGDSTMRAAAGQCFPLPYRPAIWDTGKARGTGAAGESRISYVAFHKSGEGRPTSRLELVMEDRCGPSLRRTYEVSSCRLVARSRCLTVVPRLCLWFVHCRRYQGPSTSLGT